MLARAAAHSFLEIRAVKPAGRVSRTGCADSGCFSSAPLTAPGLRDLELNLPHTGAGADLEALSKLCSCCRAERQRLARRRRLARRPGQRIHLDLLL